MVHRALGLTKSTITLGLRTPYATSTRLSLSLAYNLRENILNNPVADQIAAPTLQSVNELALAPYGSTDVESQVSFIREIVPYNLFKISATGFSIDTSKTVNFIYTDAADSTDASTSIVTGGAVEAYLLSNKLQLNIGYRLGIWGSGSVLKGQSVTITGIDSTGLPTMGLASGATNPTFSWYAMHGATAGDKLGFGSLALCMSKVAASGIGISTTTPGTLYNPAAAGTWAVAALGDTYSIRVGQEDAASVLLQVSATYTYQ